MGVTDLAVIDAVYIAVVGSGCPCIFEAGSYWKDRSSNVCYIGETQ